MHSSLRFKRPITLLVLLSLITLVGACGADSESGVRVVPVEDAAQILETPPEGLVILDVRTPQEHQAARLDDSIMIDFYEPDFEERIAELDRDAPYLLYCRSGNRSGSAREIMENMGFTNVSDVDGGINAWLEAGQPTTSG